MLNPLNKSLLSLAIITSATAITGCNSDDKNSAPSITGDINPTIAENTVEVGNYQATDPDGDNITLSLSGDSSALFSLDQSGNLEFIVAPDYDNGDVGPFNVTITATDDGKGQLSDFIDIAVTVGDVLDTPSKAAVQTIAPDYSSSEVAYISPKSAQVTAGFYIKNASDYTISSYNNSLYHIGRFGIDTIDKYEASTPDTQVWSYSTQDNQDSFSRNPYDLISVDDNKAYLLRYGSDKVWIVNPSATIAEDFKIGELDLTAYVAADNTSGTPNPVSGVINDGKLFIAMQRLSDNWAPNTTYIAVFDVATDTEIETNANADDNVMGIPLEGVNPLEHSLVSTNDTVYATTRNAYSSVDLSYSRIESINVDTYSVQSVLTASDISDNTASFIKSSVVVSEELGYFYASETLFVPSYHEVSTVYQFNPSTGEITGSNIAETGTENISFIGLDAANFLWLSVVDPANPGVDIINTQNNEKVNERLSTILNPFAIRFIEE